MPVNSEQFSVLIAESKSRSEKLRTLAPGSHIHISGVCGTGMASVLQLLKALGFYVTGSDKAFYPPMGEIVRKTADKVFESYDAKHLTPKPDFVVLGNSLVKDNPEAVYARENEIPFASMPEVFSALLIGTREECPNSIVICGTHGKSTTTAATATMFESAGRKPGFFVGGISQNFDVSLRLVDKSIPVEKRAVILEGDEYDSAFFAKWSKFHSYRADIALLTSLEFDHADIYESIAQIEEEFTRLFRSIPDTGHIVICDQGKELGEAYLKWREANFAAPMYRYGMLENSDFRLVERIPEEGGQRLRMAFPGGVQISTSTSLGGLYNALNLTGVAAVAHLSGLSPQEIDKGIAAFRGVLRRQQIIANVNNILVLEDFAHHPTAVDVTLEGIREQYPKRRLVAVFEPRSNSSRRALFQQPYVESFRHADLAVIQEVNTPAAFSGTSIPAGMLDVKKMVDDINAKGTDAYCFPEVSQIETFLKETLAPGDVVVLMSNGDFGGLMRSLPPKLER